MRDGGRIGAAGGQRLVGGRCASRSGRRGEKGTVETVRRCGWRISRSTRACWSTASTTVLTMSSSCATLSQKSCALDDNCRALLNFSESSTRTRYDCGGRMGERNVRASVDRGAMGRDATRAGRMGAGDARQTRRATARGVAARTSSNVTARSSDIVAVRVRLRDAARAPTAPAKRLRARAWSSSCSTRKPAVFFQVPRRGGFARTSDDAARALALHGCPRVLIPHAGAALLHRLRRAGVRPEP